MSVCDTCDRLSSHQALRIHVFRIHNIVLPTGYERKNALSKSKHAGVFYVCPSCVYSTESKDELKTHTEAHSLHIRSFSGADQWSLQGIDVIEKFKDFYNYCIQGINGFKDVDRFFNELL